MFLPPLVFLTSVFSPKIIFVFVSFLSLHFVLGHLDLWETPHSGCSSPGEGFGTVFMSLDELLFHIYFIVLRMVFSREYILKLVHSIVQINLNNSCDRITFCMENLD